MKVNRYGAFAHSRARRCSATCRPTSAPASSTRASSRRSAPPAARSRSRSPPPPRSGPFRPPARAGAPASSTRRRRSAVRRPPTPDQQCSPHRHRLGRRHLAGHQQLDPEPHDRVAVSFPCTAAKLAAALTTAGQIASITTPAWSTSTPRRSRRSAQRQLLPLEQGGRQLAGMGDRLQRRDDLQQALPVLQLQLHGGRRQRLYAVHRQLHAPALGPGEPAGPPEHRRAAASNRLADVKNYTFNHCYRYCCFQQCNGTSGDPILFQSNTCNNASGGTIWDGISGYQDPLGSSYLLLDSNAFNHRGAAIALNNAKVNLAKSRSPTTPEPSD